MPSTTQSTGIFSKLAGLRLASPLLPATNFSSPQPALVETHSLLLLHVTVLTRLLHSTTTRTRRPNRTPQNHRPHAASASAATTPSPRPLPHTLSPRPNPPAHTTQKTWQQDAQQDQEHTAVPWPPCSSCWARCWSTVSWCLPHPPPRAALPSSARTSSRPRRRPWAPRPCPSKPLPLPMVLRRRTPACRPPGRP